MEMKKINAGKLRAIGYDARARTLRVEFDDGSAIDYDAVGTETWRKLSSSAAPWSYYRDNIEEEFTGRRGRASGGAAAGKGAIDPDALRKAFGGGEPDGA
ncbi:KTSC domain-containing protein [uncultured Massilia sp.]|uniref:KTSC domain-containing protein n=1 Tax=uncultured Massilia sp. TaxID=169973 RepID=UPI0025DEC8AE|nr:KTSC domain-containing protein [uncultured Massilia sp.]